MTPLPKGRGTKHPGIKRLADGQWLVRKTWVDPRTGRKVDRHRLVTGTLEDAQRAQAGLREQQQSTAERTRPRFGDFASEWLKRHAKRAQLSPSTKARYTGDVAHLIVAFREWWVDALTYDALEQWQADMVAKFAAPTINGWHRTLRLILDSAVRGGLVRTNAARDLSTLTEKRTKGARGTSLEAEQLRAFVTAIPSVPLPVDVRRAVYVLAWTGMRLGEVCALHWEDIADGEIRVERSVWRTREKETKTDDPRRVTIVEPLAAVLEEQRRWLLTTQHAGISSGLVFPASPHQARAGATRRKADSVAWYKSQSTLQDAVRAVCVAAKTPRTTPHGLRRTFEDLLRSAGVEQMVRRAMAGWRSEGAQAIYATVSRRDRDAAAEAVRKLVLG